MTAFNFPAGAVADQEYTAPNGTIYVYDGEKWNVKTKTLSAVATSGEYSDLLNTPDEFKLKIGADDSTIREVGNNESILIKGGSNITTESDEEGNITINGDSGIVPGNTYDINIRGDVVGNDSSLLVDAENNEFNGDLIGDVTGSLAGNVTGDVVGSVFSDDSQVIVDAVNNTITADTLTANDKNVYFGDVARIRVAEATSTGLSAFDVHLFIASEYRSMKLIVQATNTTDTEYYVSELLCFHDGTDAYTAEYATMHTSNDPDFTIAAILDNGNFKLRVTPQVNVTINYKFIIQTMTV